MSGNLKLKYTLFEGRTERSEVIDHQTFHTPKSARIRAKAIRALKSNVKDFRIIDEHGTETEIEFSDIPA